MEARIKPGIRISDKGVVFDPYTGESFTVNETGGEILACMVEGLGKEEIYERMSSKYLMTQPEFERNYLDFITVLKSCQLLGHES
jgi:hypothetical protein